MVRGDLIKLALAGKFDVIIHGCNCMRAMGAGIAKGIKATCPEAYRLRDAEGRAREAGHDLDRAH